MTGATRLRRIGASGRNPISWLQVGRPRRLRLQDFCLRAGNGLRLRAGKVAGSTNPMAPASRKGDGFQWIGAQPLDLAERLPVPSSPIPKRAPEISMSEFACNEGTEGARERVEMDRVVGVLREAREKGPLSRERVAALFPLRRLWTIVRDGLEGSDA